MFVDFWNLRISQRAMVPGRYRRGFLMPPPEEGAWWFRAALVDSCFRGTLDPVDLRAVCFSQAIVAWKDIKQKNNGGRRKC